MLKFPSLSRHFFARILLAFSLLSLCGCGSRADQTSARSTPVAARPSTPTFTTALDTYMAREEPAYKWEKISEKQIGKNLVTTLLVTSQTWQNIAWKHRVEIATPDKNEFPGWALLYLSTTDSVIESILTQSLATKMGATTIHVMGIPNQPLFGKREDALMAHTFSQFIDGKDDTWPLLLPMTKGANKVMDAVQEYSAQQKTPLNKFIVTGASKRGWTTWLVGATDTKNRIGGIIPMVYDNLNTEKQLPHQKESWGDYSPMIADYTRNNLQEKMRTPRGKELTQIIDPYYYRSRLTMPKLIVNATNDPYWTTDALNLYWDDLPGPKNVYYAPNVGHTMEGDLENVFGTSAAWFRKVAGGKGLPLMDLHLAPKDFPDLDPTNPGFVNPIELSVTSTDIVKKVDWWVAGSPTKDFRKAVWKKLQIESHDKQLTNSHGLFVKDRKTNDFVLDYVYPRDKANYQAVFADCQFGEANSTLRISSPILVWSIKHIKTGPNDLK